MEFVAIAVILVILALLALSGISSATETALTAASRPRMHALARKGNQRAILINRLRENRGQLISAILIGNNLVNILASALATGLLIDWYGEAGIAYAVLGMSALIVVFGEVLPKTFALNRPDRIALYLVPFASLLLTVMGPIAHFVSAIARLLLRPFGAHVPVRGPFAAQEELRGAIELHARPGAAVKQVVKQERAMLHSILDLAEVEVGQIMVHRQNLVTIDIAERPAKIVEQALASPYTRIPMWRGQPDNIVGVLHAKALLAAVREHGGRLDAINVAQATKRPWFVPESTSLLTQLQAFRRRREHFALVVDEYGALLGIVTLEDILEEIVGDIAEQHEFKMPGLRPGPAGSFIVEGYVTIRDLNRQFDWSLPDDKAATIAGLILHEARRIPEVGQTFNFHGFRFEILRRQRNQIVSLRLTPPMASGSSSADPLQLAS